MTTAHFAHICRPGSYQYVTWRASWSEEPGLVLRWMTTTGQLTAEPAAWTTSAPLTEAVQSSTLDVDPSDARAADVPPMLAPAAAGHGTWPMGGEYSPWLVWVI